MSAWDSDILGHVILLNMEGNSTSIPTEIQHLLEQYRSVFAEPKGLPLIDLMTMLFHSNLMLLLVNLRPYRFLYNQKAEVEKHIATMLSSSVIQPSKSPFASPCLLIKKKDDTWRFCVYYRELNSLTIKDKFPIPIVEDLLDELYGTIYFSKINLRLGYWQIRIKPEDIYKTAFRTHQCHYEFKVEYLGHIISAAGVSTDPSKVEAMQNWPKPKTLKSLRGFLGLTRYYRRFIKNYDASSGGIGDVLAQEGTYCLFESSSKSKNSALSIYEKEYLAILLAKLTTTIQKKGLTKLLGLDYTIQYRKGKLNVVADALSTRWEDQAQCFVLGATVLVPTWVQEVEDCYQGDTLEHYWISTLIINPTTNSKWKYSKAVLRCSCRVYIGDHGSLRLKVIKTLHDSPQ
ncbi:uncharacterized protein LOC120166978 [Hibiscus syriacus]|uniref:uncharacterized protein LOC120166978 n=1 Tax=Hibiscus syriacus TaxID=106335 RepID=UPI001924CDCA|nr:uncharacterized protein LOC120166978 [Hibiscus syriacus]